MAGSITSPSSFLCPQGHKTDCAFNRQRFFASTVVQNPKMVPLGYSSMSFKAAATDVMLNSVAPFFW